MTLEEVSQRISNIQQLAAAAPAEAMKADVELFLDLARQDRAFFAAGADGSPYAAVAQEGDPRPFLRIFSHAEASTVFLERGAQIEETDGIGLMRLAKNAFLRGTYGLLLNDGSAWAAIAIPDFLSACFRCILKDPALYGEGYVALMQIVGSLRWGGSLEWADMGKKGIWIVDRDPPGPSKALDLPTLVQFSGRTDGAPIHIRIEGHPCDVSIKMLRAACRITGLLDGQAPPVDEDPILEFRPKDFEGEADIGAPAKKKARLPRTKRRGGRKLVAAAVLLAVLVAAVVVVAWPDSPYERFQKELAEGDRASAIALYPDCGGDQRSALQMMRTDLDDSVQRYAAGEIAAEELMDIITAYRAAADMSGAAESAYVRATGLESSKIAYKAGAAATDVCDRLEYWREVTEEDIQSHEAVEADLQAHAAEYKQAVYAEAAELPTAAALSRLILLQSYWPDDTDITEKIRSLQTGSLPDPVQTDQPIAITRLAVHRGGWDGAVDLYIDWEDRSGKQIEEVDFEVIPYDRAGKQVSTKQADDGGEAYSRYLARDVGPFEAGYATPDKHLWPSAWINGAIASVRIDKVSVFFSDGSAPAIITDNAAIEAMCGEIAAE